LGEELKGLVMVSNRAVLGGVLLWAVALAGCESGGREQVATAQSCMTCHNGSQHDDYAGPGMENPHPFPGAANLQCTTCHGGNPNGADKVASHVPPPPEIGDRSEWVNDAHAYFNRLTLAGIDKFADYQVGGVTYSAIDYLQFINPGDLRVVTQNRSCGTCHQGHADCVAKSPLATETGFFSGGMYAIGSPNALGNTSYEDTAADYGFRAVTDNGFVFDPNVVGPVGSLIEFPVISVRGQRGSDKLFENRNEFLAGRLANDLNADFTVKAGSPLESLYREQVSFTCGDCHLGHAGANNRAGDFRSSGCTACHMRAALDGRSHSNDPNVSKTEPVDPDDIDPPELSHVRVHRIASVAKTLPSGVAVQGIDDYTCAGCHQGSNRTVMQYWGIRLDQNADVVRRVQYPANPASFQTTRNDTRLFDPQVGNNTFNGRNHNQYLLEEDYDGDGRDDTPADVHYEAGMGCIDCHGSHDLHGGDVNSPNGGRIMSRMEQVTAIQCEDCHGRIESYAATTQGTNLAGEPAEVAMDSKGNQLHHVVKESDGNFYLTSKLTGQRHFVPQTMDTVVNNGKRNPFTNEVLYNAKASYAMGRLDADPSNGIGPQQTGCTNCAQSSFSHTDNMSCIACHGAWTNTCVGCHLSGEYDNGNNFSNITGQRIVFQETTADFTYQSVVPFQLGIDAHGKITQVSTNTKVFFKYRDIEGNFSQVFAFTDRKGLGNTGNTAFRALGHNALAAHSIRGRVTGAAEGPRYCVACHLTQDGLSSYGLGNYQTFIADMSAGNYDNLDFNELQTHIGRNPSNRLNSPLWVHMVAGLGSGTFLFDQNGCPVNPLDDDDERKGCNGVAPSATPFSANRVWFNLDRIVEWNGAENSSSNHALLDAMPSPLRGGNTRMAGPLGPALIQLLADPVNGVILDSYIDADGNLQGDASQYVK
jgi:hypothetical protein